MFLRISALLGLTALCIYLFVTAPLPLPDAEASAEIPIEEAFEVLARENNEARKLWTTRIVGAGKKAGLRFAEKWLDKGVEAGPLPALFLRETSRQMHRLLPDLTMFLGSDAPIEKTNLFDGEQARAFARIRATGAPQFFHDVERGTHTAMFPDVATAAACVTCHNAHVDSPRDDWALDEVMGATTWTYNKKVVSLKQLLEFTEVYRSSTRLAYQRYLDKVATFEDPPLIGGGWPGEGERVLPSADEFMRAVEETVSDETIAALFEAARADR